ncbi:MAG TPA: serine kinase [Clostridiales bacterium]|jgi:phosphotransferase system HPr-like phosphotransfer protein|nr:HPr family phosphocarrier protein [Eubacteriales bacterium]HBR32282.1 serine kinase [Clostridiales bacterium]
MKEMMIKLETIKDVQTFVSVVEKCPFSVDLSSGRYTVDAKSIMGIFSLDLMKPIKLIAYHDDSEVLKQFEPFKA